MGISISKEFIKMIPLKMMYYPDFFLFPHRLPRPRLSRLLQLGLIKKEQIGGNAPDCLREPIKLYIGCRHEELGCEGRGD